MYPSAHCSTVYSRQDVGSSRDAHLQMGDWVKEMRYMHTVDYHSAMKRTDVSQFQWWMNLEPVIQSEVNQKNKYILKHTQKYI